MDEIVRSLYFDDFHVGQQFVSKARTLAEADIVNFAGLSWDHNQLHTNTPEKRSMANVSRTACWGSWPMPA